MSLGLVWVNSRASQHRHETKVIAAPKLGWRLPRQHTISCGCPQDVLGFHECPVAVLRSYGCPVDIKRTLVSPGLTSRLAGAVPSASKQCSDNKFSKTFVQTRSVYSQQIKVGGLPEPTKTVLGSHIPLAVIVSNANQIIRSNAWKTLFADTFQVIAVASKSKAKSQPRKLICNFDHCGMQTGCWF